MFPTFIGLTGGMGVGKSSVAQIFRALGIPVIDADAISHHITASQQCGSLAVAKHFGRQYLTADGAMDRVKMRSLLLQNPRARTQLRNILHPLIWQESCSQYHMLKDQASYVIFDCPLLFEKKEWYQAMQRTLLIDLPVEEQIERIARRNGHDRATILGMLSWQMPRAQRLHYATDILVNYDGPSRLAQRVESLHHFYLSQFEPKKTN